MQKTTGRILLSRYRLTELECRLVFHLIRQIETDGCGLAAYRYAVKKLLRVARLPVVNKQSLFQIITDLFQKPIHINKPTGWVKHHWFDDVEWDSADDVLIIRFNEELKPYLQQLRKKYSFRDFQKMNACGVFPWTETKAEPLE